METSTATQSFLCLLPEHPCTSTNVIYFNGVTESNAMQHFPTTKFKKGLNRPLDSPNRLKSSPAETVSGVGNGCIENRLSSTAGDECQREALIFGSSAAAGIENVRDESDQPHVVTRTLSLSFNKVESKSFPVAECNDHCNLFRVSVEEEDELAFQITEFFNAFRDGKEHVLRKWIERSNIIFPDSSLDPRISQSGLISNSKSTDDQSGLGKLGMLSYDTTDGGMTLWSSSASRSGNWNGLPPADTYSQSATLFGPLSFSGQISFNGHSGLSPCSGSMSHRSDSSTASTRSFAFPILPYEWNSSPVKMPMAQPDQRFLKKGWRQRLRALFCC